MKKILITGGSGFLGGHLLSYFSKNPDLKLYATYNSKIIEHPFNAQTFKLDITEEASVSSLIEGISPDVIIHTAALTNSNQCFSDKKLAVRINVSGTKNIKDAAKKCNSRLIYTSTDLIHEGSSKFYNEDEPVTPICSYGITKLKGEEEVFKMKKNFCILRVALMYGISKNQNKTFSELMIENVKKKTDVTLFTDEYRTPLYVSDLCRLLDEIIKQPDVTGIYNVCGNERLSRYDFGIKLCDAYSLGKSYLKPVSVSAFNFKDGRPKDCSMDNTKVLETFGFKFLSLEDAMKNKGFKSK